MEYYGYLYAYFRWLKPGKDLQQIYFALSRDGLHYSALNGNEPVLESVMGTKAVRDPHIIRSRADGQFYILATDLDTRENRWNDYIMNGSKYIAVWQSPDLIHWEKQKMVNLVDDSIGCVWAPKVCYDEQQKDYVVFFSGSEAGTKNLKIFYCRTRDFYTYTKPQVLMDKKENVKKEKYWRFGFAPKWISFIDSTTVPVGDHFYRFTKNETLKVIQCEKSDRLLDGYTLVQSAVAGERGVEGPCVYKLFDQDKWVLLADGHRGPNSGVGYFPLTASTQELEQGNFTRLSADKFSLPQGCKHGSVIPVTRQEYERLEK